MLVTHRTKKHAVLRFRDFPETSDQPPLKIPETPEYHISVETIYKSLVPFGLSYHNLKDGVTISDKGTIGGGVCAVIG